MPLNKGGFIRKITSIHLHCSDSDVPEHDNVYTIDRWHREKNGWDCIGYHFYIQFTGAIQLGRPIWMDPASILHHNQGAIAICMGGKDKINGRQQYVVMNLCMNLQEIFNVADDKIFGHYELDPNKTCPNINMELFRSRLRWKRKELKNSGSF